MKGQLDTGSRKVLKTRTSAEAGEDSSGRVEREQEVVLTREDKHGNLYPIQLQTGSDELTRKRARKKKIVSRLIVYSFCQQNQLFNGGKQLFRKF